MRPASSVLAARADSATEAARALANCRAEVILWTRSSRAAAALSSPACGRDEVASLGLKLSGEQAEG